MLLRGKLANPDAYTGEYIWTCERASTPVLPVSVPGNTGVVALAEGEAERRRNGCAVGHLIGPHRIHARIHDECESDDLIDDAVV